MSTYLDQSSTNLDLSSAETPQAPNKEIKLFNLGGGPPNKENLNDELLETLVDGDPRKGGRRHRQGIGLVDVDGTVGRVRHA